MKPWINMKSVVFTIATIGFACYAIWYSASPKVNLVDTEYLDSSPDYFLTKVTTKEFDKDGVLIKTLNAEQTLHYINDSRTVIESPHVERKSNHGSWSALAEKGMIEDGSNDILLTQNVTATKKHGNSEDVTLKADTIHYLDDAKSLTSTGSPKLISIQGSTSADIITTYINSEKVTMTGSVRGNYETPK